MAKYAMLIDEKLCVTCGACVIACKEENKVPDGFHRDWTVEVVSGTFPNVKLELRSERCNHCENPYCVYVCPTGASYIEDGIVLIDHDKCAGCGACVAACPYGARYLHPDGFADKCTFCAHKRDKNGKYTDLPSCVKVCPTYALTFGDLEDKNSEISIRLEELKKEGRKIKVLKPEKGTKPKYFVVESDVERVKI